ncbi:CotD family spore coat protein [Caldalkalibacillus salinus]|uniref:CotD family spore coat protein n=1 Tax=Caldalkalibacillus salinus TaxID=2803787 RepID=UPI001920C8B0|nr:CotD family spore coat protein [Caldalkalibacillus salinus]
MNQKRHRSDMAGYGSKKPMFPTQKKKGAKHPTQQQLPQQQPMMQQPQPMQPTQPTQVAPATTGPGTQPGTMAPMGGFPQGAPAQVAPVRRVQHPTQVLENHTVTRYPVVNVYPTHVRNVRHHVCEYYCECPVTQSVEDCYHVVDHCNRPPRRPYRR